MNLLAAAHPEYRWAPEPPGLPLVLGERVAALDRVVNEDDEPAVLVAHSAGCLATVVWAARHRGPVRAALLVTPPWVAGDVYRDGAGVAWPVPRGRLPFRAVVVASRSDPYCWFDDFVRYAEDWGAELFDAGDVGHLDTATGFGPWPEGERLIRELG